VGQTRSVHELTASAVEDAAGYLDGWIAFQRRLDRVPGVQVAVLHEDRLVLSSAHGHADLEADVALTPSHLFRIASHSKTFTATAVMQLVEDGRLRLDDRVADHLDQLDGSPAGRRTVRELLAHGGGLVRDGWDGDFWQLHRPFPDEDELVRISTDAADVLPANARFKYSNIGFGLLGLVIEAVTGHPYEAHIAERIVGPLGLEDTGPELDPARIPEVATGYGSLSYLDRRVPIETVPTGALASATGFFSTAADVVRYAAAHFEGDERLLTDASKRVAQRTEWQVEGSAAGRHYGLGFAVTEIGSRRLLGHGGGFPGHITHTLFDPGARFAVSVLTNCIDGPAQTLAAGAVRLVDLAAAGPGQGSGDLERFCGRFANLWGVFDIVALGGALYRLDPTLADPTSDRSRLEVIDDDTVRIVDAPGYASPGERYEIEREPDGTIRSLRGGSATTSYPLGRFEAAAETHGRVRLGDPLRPG
jgi:CubicO group peptidase (beta-lactamase class C family)